MRVHVWALQSAVTYRRWRSAELEGAEQARIQVPTRASAAVSWDFEHPEAVPTPPGGGAAC